MGNINPMTSFFYCGQVKIHKIRYNLDYSKSFCNYGSTVSCNAYIGKKIIST